MAEFNLPKNQSNIIKVIGIGGGGSNAVNHMYAQGIKGVDYVVCNTDAQALENSNVPHKIQIGSTLTEGLGAGSNPEIGKKAAEESLEELKSVLETKTKMVFITAGMGGGTGTGAAPVVAKLAKDMGILTVGIVTIPFSYEGKKRGEQAREGLEKLRQNVDSLIVINNNKLSEIYGDLGVKQSYAKADEVLSTAAKGIAEVISKHYLQNIDLEDARTVLASGGTAIMGAAQASGEGRAKNAIEGALNSPLLNDNKITGARNVLLLIVFGKEEITQAEVKEINDYIQSEAGNEAEIIMGIGEDLELDEQISVTVIATGFNPDQQNKIVNTPAQKTIYGLDGDHQVTRDLTKSSTIIKTELNIDDIQVQIPENQEGTDRDSITQVFSLDVDCEEITDIQFVEQRELETVQVEQKQQSLGVSRFANMKPIVETKNTSSQLDLELFPEMEISQKPKEKKVLTLVQDENRLSVKTEKPVSESKSSKIKMEEAVWETQSWDAKSDDNSVIDELRQTTPQRRKMLKEMSYRFDTTAQDQNIPAYKRQNIELSPLPQQKEVSNGMVSVDSNGEIQVRKNNSYLHDNVD